MAKILIADDHSVARRGLKTILQEAIPFLDIMAVPDAEELYNQVVKENWDMVITDITMPGRSGLEVLHDIKRLYPGLPVLVLSVHPEEEYAVRAIKAGASGYLNKDDAVEEELVKSVQTILGGHKYITPKLAERMAAELSKPEGKEPHEQLSDREFQVFRLLANGKSTGEIAKMLSLSVNTIGTFRSRILAKMNMKNNTELAAYAIRHGIEL